MGERKSMKRVIAHTDIDAEILCGGQCQFDHACLTDWSMCRTEWFLDRDVELLRCLNDRKCRYRARYGNMFLCMCPVRQDGARKVTRQRFLEG
jgi:hypothetical protein